MKTLANSTTRKPASAGGSVAGRLRLRDDFFRNQAAAKELLQPFEHLPGILYFVKDSKSRLMAISRESVARMGFETEEEIIGRTVQDYLPSDLADKYLADDEWVIRHGKPRLNIVEMWFNEQGLRDWIITDKYPLRNARGKVVGLIGTVQTFGARRKLLAHLGPVGQAADYIRDHLGDPMMVSEIARHAGFSERQLQRLFRRVFGMSMQQFIIQSRIQAAIHELTHSQRSIAEIAILFGFSDQSAFTNKFRAITGLPPRAYRERYLARLTP
jgi:AraC-like DNA-binding protein